MKGVNLMFAQDSNYQKVANFISKIGMTNEIYIWGVNDNFYHVFLKLENSRKIAKNIVCLDGSLLKKPIALGYGCQYKHPSAIENKKINSVLIILASAHINSIYDYIVKKNIVFNKVYSFDVNQEVFLKEINKPVNVQENVALLGASSQQV